MRHQCSLSCEHKKSFISLVYILSPWILFWLDWMATVVGAREAIARNTLWQQKDGVRNTSAHGEMNGSHWDSRITNVRPVVGRGQDMLILNNKINRHSWCMWIFFSLSLPKHTHTCKPQLYLASFMASVVCAWTCSKWVSMLLRVWHLDQGWKIGETPKQHS